MDKFLKYIGIGLFVGWIIALIANYSIYQYTTIQITFIHPIVDATIFMGILIAIYFLAMALYKKSKNSASLLLAGCGIVSVVLAVVFII